MNRKQAARHERFCIVPCGLLRFIQHTLACKTFVVPVDILSERLYDNGISSIL